MAGPWEKYASQATDSAPPWEKYGAPKTAQPTGLSALPPEAGAPQNAVDASTQPEDSLVNKVKGVGEAGAALATGAVAGPVGQAYGAAKALTSGKYGTQAGVEAGEKAGSELTNKLTYQPKTKTGQEAVGAIGNALDESRLAGLPVEGSVLNQFGKVPAAAAEAEGALKAAPKAIAKAAIDKLPGIDPETAQLAKDAHSMGFRLTPDQVIGGKYAKALGEGAAAIPLSGSNTKLNQNVFNQQLVKQIGGTGDKLTRKTFDTAMKASGSTIGDIAERTPLPIKPNLVAGLREHAQGQLPDVANVVNHYVDLVNSQAKDGVLDGTTFRKINTDLGNRIRSTSNGDLKFALNGLQEDLLDAREPYLSAEDAKAYNAARKQYAIGKTLEPLVAKSPTGDIPPSLLLGVISSTKSGKSAVARGAAGDLGKLADIGQRFLKQNPSNGTAERSWAQGIPATLGGLAGGTAGAAGAGAGAAGGLAAAYGAANLYNRVGPAVTQQLIDRPPR
jgi:hypothetical protein